MGKDRKGWSGSVKDSIIRRNNKAATTATEMPSTPNRGIVSIGATTSEEESSSNSTGNNTSVAVAATRNLSTIGIGGLDERTAAGNAKMRPAAIRSISQTSSSYLVMMQSSSASTSPAARNFAGHKQHRTTKKCGRQRSNASGKSCFFGIFDVETGARLFLVFYILINACGVAFGSVATMVWILVPLVVIPLAIYSLVRHRSKYLYPFLVISVIHSLVALLMVLIVGCFSLLCFDQLKAHFAKSLAFQSGSFSSASFTVLCCALTMTLSLGLALFFSWQSLVLFSCITHFDTKCQEQLQQKQQCQRQLGNKESRVMFQQPREQQSMVAMASPLLEQQRSTTFSRQMDTFSQYQGAEEIQQ